MNDQLYPLLLSELLNYRVVNNEIRLGRDTEQSNLGCLGVAAVAEVWITYAGIAVILLELIHRVCYISKGNTSEALTKITRTSNCRLKSSYRPTQTLPSELCTATKSFRTQSPQTVNAKKIWLSSLKYFESTSNTSELKWPTPTWRFPIWISTGRL